MIKFSINDQTVEAQPGWTVLETALHHGIYIPTLCHHEAVEPSGACRLCVVELKDGDWSKVVISCMYPAQEGLNVYTETERVQNVRRWILKMLLAECPASPEIKRLAERLGVARKPLRGPQPGGRLHALRALRPGLPGGGGRLGHLHGGARRGQGNRRTVSPAVGRLRGLRLLRDRVPHRRHAPAARHGEGGAQGSGNPLSRLKRGEQSWQMTTRSEFFLCQCGGRVAPLVDLDRLKKRS